MDREIRHRWWVHVLLLMPDHLHLLISATPLLGLADTVGSWKRFTARFVGIRWQRDFFEHRLRRDESFSEKAEYIRQNPVRAGLVKTPDDWPYLWQKAR